MLFSDFIPPFSPFTTQELFILCMHKRQVNFPKASEDTQHRGTGCKMVSQQNIGILMSSSDLKENMEMWPSGFPQVAKVECSFQLIKLGMIFKGSNETFQV
jgi:hypothetical protein